MNTARIDPRPICRSLLLGILAMTLGCGEDTLVSPGIVVDRETYEDSAVQTLNLAGVGSVVAGTLNGSIAVRGQASASARLEIRKVVQAPTLAEAQEVAEQVRVEVRILDGELVLRWTPPASRPGVSVRVDYDLAGPAGVDLGLEVTNGEISVEGMSGAVMAEMANGRIEIAPSGDAGGAVTARVVNGVIDVDLPDRGAYDLTATTISGCILGSLAGDVVDQCRAGTQVVRLGGGGGIPCDLRVVNGTIEINRR